MASLVTILLLFVIPILILLVRRRNRLQSKKIPPGSLGFPIIGQSLSFLWAMKANRAEAWIEERAKKYGPISKLSLFGQPTVFIYGQAANKLVFGSSHSTVRSEQPASVKRVLGDRNIIVLNGDDHKRIREALVSFLKPEILKQYVGNMDEEIRRHLQMYWEGKENVAVLPLMKTLTFNLISSLVLGVEPGPKRDEFVSLFETMLGGVWSVPINFPLSPYNRALKASVRLQNMVKELIHQKRVELEDKSTLPTKDFITCLLSKQNKDNKQVLSDDEIVHNIMLVMLAGYDTSATLVTFMVRALAKDKGILAGVVQEQEMIAKSKTSGESITWEDLGKMKYTWKVALETLRMFPPIFASFREAVRDIEYEGYVIPQGWKILWVSSMTHMDANIFKEPSKFDPARFDDPASIPPYNFIAFGAGYRICPGYEFAKIETLTFIHYLVTRYTWNLCSKDDTFSRDPIPTPAKGLPIQLFPKN